MRDQRKEHRARTYLGGQIAFDDRRCTMDGLVRNLSQNGAKIVFAHPVVLPQTFDLVIKQKARSRFARIVWMNETEVGVTFDAASSGTVVSIETARRIRTLEAEREALARRVTQLSEPM